MTPLDEALEKYLQDDEKQAELSVGTDRSAKMFVFR